MRGVLFLLGWALGVGAFWWFAWRVSRTWQSLGLGIGRALLRSFAVSLAFAPTAIVGGWVGVPCPASAAFILFVMDGWSGPMSTYNRGTAFLLFFGFWAIAFLIAAFRFLWVYDRRKNDHAEAPGSPGVSA